MIIELIAAMFGASGQLGDGVTTYVGSSKGLHEGNPFWAKFGITSKTGLLAAKMGLAAASFLPLLFHNVEVVVPMLAFVVTGGVVGAIQTYKNAKLL